MPLSPPDEWPPALQTADGHVLPQSGCIRRHRRGVGPIADRLHRKRPLATRLSSLRSKHEETPSEGSVDASVRTTADDGLERKWAPGSASRSSQLASWRPLRFVSI